MRDVTVMIIDDERRTRDGLKKAIEWQKLGISLLCEAEDGRNGLVTANQLQPELILCDIKMPDIDGIEFASKLLEKLPLTKLIFITGYSKPEYMKKAIRLEAVDFIEKPVDIEELNESLRRAIKQIRTEEKLRNSYKNLQTRVRLSKSVITSQLFEDLCSPGASPLSIQEKLKVINNQLVNRADYRSLVCCLKSTVTKIQQKHICDTSEEIMCSLGITGIVGIYKDTYFVNHIKANNEGDEFFIHYFHKLNHLCDSPFYGSSLGMQVNSLLSISRSFMSAQIISIRERFFERDSLSFWTEEPLSILLYQPLLDQLAQALETKSEELSKSLCITILSKMKNEKNLSLDCIKTVLLDIQNMFKLTAQNNSFFLSVDTIEKENFYEHNFTFYSAIILKQMERILQGFSTQAPPGDLLIQILKYVDEHYCETSLSLKSLSGAIYLSHNYISSYFKKAHGQTFNHYLTALRISKAKQLLSNREYKLYEIAQMVGFQDENYFCKVFKKSTGVTPLIFRQKGIK